MRLLLRLGTGSVAVTSLEKSRWGRTRVGGAKAGCQTLGLLWPQVEMVARVWTSQRGLTELALAFQWKDPGVRALVCGTLFQESL